MVTRHLHLARRGAIYQWRARLPRALQVVLGKSHLVWSLRTPDPTVARRRARAFSAAIDGLETQLMNIQVPTRPSKLQLRLVLESIFNKILAEGEQRRDADPEGFARYASEDKEPIVLTNLNSEDWTHDDWQKYSDAMAEDMNHPDNIAAEWEGLAQGNVVAPIETMLNEELATHDLTLEAGTVEYATFARDATRVAARAHAIDKERWQGRFDDNQGMPSFIAQKYPLDSKLLQTWTTNLDKEDVKFLSTSIQDLAKEFSKFREHRGIAVRTKSDDDIARRYFIDLVGNLPVKDITPRRVEEFATRLLRMPCEYGKGIYANIAPSKAIKLADTLAAKLDKFPDQEFFTVHDRKMHKDEVRRRCERMRKKTANKHLTFFTSLWRSPLVPRTLRVMNPFEGTLFKKSQIANESAQKGTRVSFTRNQMAEIFAAPIWNGCNKTFQDAQLSDPGLEDWKYWCPLIAAHTGLRREEVARLRTDDFDTSGSIWFVRIQATHGRHLKSKASIRDIPIHARLIELGLAEFVQNKGRSKPLFNALSSTGAYKEHGEKLGRWFRNFRQASGIYSKHTDFHSFRHSFVQKLQDQSVTLDLIALLAGHEYPGVTVNVYGHQVAITLKNDAIQKLNFEGVFLR